MTFDLINVPTLQPDIAVTLVEAIVCRKVLRVLSGTALGLSQQLIQFELSTLPGYLWDFSLVDTYMEALTGETLDPAIAAQSGDSALLMRIHHGYSAFLRSTNIPIFDHCNLSLSRSNPETGRVDWKLALPSINPQLSIKVLAWLVPTVNVLLTSPPDMEARLQTSSRELEQLKPMLRQKALGSTNMIHFLQAAHQLHMPFTDLGNGIYAIGTGRNCRWFNSTITDETSNIGCRLAKNKKASANLLRKFCLPVPDHQLAPTEDRAVEIAAALGYPVVVKPLDQDQGRGVFAGLTNERSLRRAYRAAREFSEKVLVERHYYGEDYRFTVMHDRVIKVMHRQAASITGDGQRSVRQLFEALQGTSDQQRALRRDGKLRIELDDEVLELLEEQGISITDIPAANQKLLLRRKSNISVGGSHYMVSPENIHPDNGALAVRVAKILGLDFAGIDLIIADIALPWHQTGAIICEVNAQPQLGYRDMPELYRRILQEMISDGGKVPLYLLPIDGDMPHDDQQLRALAHSLGCNALSTPQGVWQDGTQVAWSPRSSFDAARALLLDKQTVAGLMVMTFADIVRHGLPIADFKQIGIARDDSESEDASHSKTEKLARAMLNRHEQGRAQLGQFQPSSRSPAVANQ